MAAIDFPASPTANQIFSSPSGVIYRWQATPGMWLAVGQSSPGGDFSAIGSFAPGGTSNNLVFPTVLTGNAPIGGVAPYNVSTGRYTPPAGRYRISCGASIGYNAGAILVGCSLLKNGTTYHSQTSVSQGANNTAYVGVDIEVDSNGTDYWQVNASSNVGWNVTGNAFFTATPISGTKGPQGDPGQLGWRLLQRVVPTAGQATIDFTNLPSDINDLRVGFDVLPVTNVSALVLQFFDAAGALANTAYNWSNAITYSTMASSGPPLGSSTSSTGNSTAMFINSMIGGNAMTNAAGSGIKGTIDIPNIRDTTRTKGATWMAVYLNDGSTAYDTSSGGGHRAVIGAITGLRLTFGGAGFQAGGAVSLWGSP